MGDSSPQSGQLWPTKSLHQSLRSYAFCLGVTPYVTLRFFHHAAVEYFVIAPCWENAEAYPLVILLVANWKIAIFDR
jgi:hypothetical protein